MKVSICAILHVPVSVSTSVSVSVLVPVPVSVSIFCVCARLWCSDACVWCIYVDVDLVCRRFCLRLHSNHILNRVRQQKKKSWIKWLSAYILKSRRC